MCAAPYSCGEDRPREQYEEVQNGSVAADTVGKKSHADSVTSAYLDEMIHSGRTVLLNFCYCCDCTVTIPMLQSAINALGDSVNLFGIDAKEHLDLADEYDVRRGPFYILFDESGVRVDTLCGYEGSNMLDSTYIERWLRESLRLPKEGVMKIEVFGPGCAKCATTAKNAQDALDKLGIDAHVVKIERLEEIVVRGVLMTPAVFIDGQKVSEGKVARTDQITEWIQSRLRQGEDV